jgi:DNA-binding transcriptional LysR family regulator
VARTLRKDKLVAVASPSYPVTHGTPRTRKDLRSHRCLMAFARKELPQTHWPMGKAMVHVEGSFFTNELGLLRHAALQGLGIAFLPLLVVRDQLDGGELVQVLSGVLEAENRVSIVYPEREFVPAQVACVCRRARWLVRQGRAFFAQEAADKGAPPHLT